MTNHNAISLLLTQLQDLKKYNQTHSMHAITNLLLDLSDKDKIDWLKLLGYTTIQGDNYKAILLARMQYNDATSHRYKNAYQSLLQLNAHYDNDYIYLVDLQLSKKRHFEVNHIINHDSLFNRLTLIKSIIDRQSDLKEDKAGYNEAITRLKRHPYRVPFAAIHKIKHLDILNLTTAHDQYLKTVDNFIDNLPVIDNSNQEPVELHINNQRIKDLQILKHANQSHHTIYIDTATNHPIRKDDTQVMDKLLLISRVLNLVKN